MLLEIISISFLQSINMYSEIWIGLHVFRKPFNFKKYLCHVLLSSISLLFRVQFSSSALDFQCKKINMFKI